MISSQQFIQIAVIAVLDCCFFTHIGNIFDFIQVPHLHRMMSSKTLDKRDRKDQLKRNATMAKLDQVPPLTSMLEVCFCV